MMRLPDKTKKIEEQDAEVLAVMNIWSEARGETFEAMKGVMEVVLNRVKLQGYMGKDVKSVILKKYAFSWLNPGSPVREKALDPLKFDSEKTWNKCWAAFFEVMGGATPLTDEATHYYDTSLKGSAIPKWATDPSTTYKCQLGKLKFFRAL